MLVVERDGEAVDLGLAAVVAASTSPVRSPLLIDTVADCRVWLSTSLTAAAGDSVSGAAFSL